MKILVIGGTGFIGYHVIKAKKRGFVTYSVSLNNQKKICQRCQVHKGWCYKNWG